MFNWLKSLFFCSHQYQMICWGHYISRGEKLDQSYIFGICSKCHKRKTMEFPHSLSVHTMNSILKAMGWSRNDTI